MLESQKEIKSENDQVMNEELNNRCKWIHLRLTLAEYEILHQQFKKSTCRKISDYGRRMLLAKPMIAGYHNQSLDAFMAEAIRLRKELNGVGNNLNQAVKRMHALQQIAEVKPWIQEFESDYKRAMADIADIKMIVSKISDSWLQ
jgi:hypothetical protein